MRREISEGSPGISGIPAGIALKVVVSGEEIHYILEMGNWPNFEWQCRLR